jgi:hypothetical protein
MDQAARYRIQQRKLTDMKRNKISRVPPVSIRPGSPLERPSEQDARIHSLNKGGGALTPKEAAALVVAQRAMRRG